MDNQDKEFTEIGNRLRTLRTLPAVSLSVGEMSDRLGLKPSMIYACETGRRLIPIHSAISLCDLTGATLDYIYRGVPDALPNSLRISLNLISGDDVSEINRTAPASDEEVRLLVSRLEPTERQFLVNAAKAQIAARALPPKK